MAGWDGDSLGPPIVEVQVDLYTAGYRVSGTMLTRFRRVADILNLTGSDHLVVERATVSEYADPGAARGSQQVMVTIDAVLFGISTGADDSSTEELVVHKRPVQAQIGMPPFWLTGNVHVPQGSRPMDGLLNVADRFLPLTEVAINSAAYPAFDRIVPVLAVQRSLAQILQVADDAAPDVLLAEILPEDSVRGWLPPEGESPS